MYLCSTHLLYIFLCNIQFDVRVTHGNTYMCNHNFLFVCFSYRAITIPNVIFSPHLFHSPQIVFFYIYAKSCCCCFLFPFYSNYRCAISFAYYMYCEMVFFFNFKCCPGLPLSVQLLSEDYSVSILPFLDFW
jgi:hypothetical protein